jgi:uncharacterized protein (DUF58 family)
MTPAWAREVASPAFLEALERLTIPRRGSVRDDAGAVHGRAPRASGLDWVGHRRYQPGDDLRYLDWQLLARIGRPYVRRFVSERSGRVDILIDRSRSMSLGDPSKADVGSALAFVFGHVALSTGERVAATAFSDRPLSSLPAGRGPAHRARLLQFLIHAPRGERTAVDTALTSFADRAREIGQAIVISDLLDDRFEAGLRALRRRGFEVGAVRLRSAGDEAPDFSGDTAMLLDVESGRRKRITLLPGDRERFRRQRSEELERALGYCSRAGIVFASLGTWQPLREMVFGELRGAGMLAAGGGR